MDSLSLIKNFAIEYFWLPIIGQAAPYNTYNTVVYAGLAAAIAIYLIPVFLNKIGVEPDRNFFIGIAPYVFLGGAVRVLQDRAILDTVLLVTPFIYFVMFFVTIGLLALSIKIFGDRYYKPFGIIGLLLLLATVSLYGFTDLQPLPITLAIFGASIGAGYLLLKFVRPDLVKYSFIIPIASHYWDASTTVSGLMFGAEEKHVLANFFINTMGYPGMFVMKTVIIVPAVYYIDQNIEDRQEKLYYLFIIALLGIGLGVRNLLSIMSV